MFDHGAALIVEDNQDARAWLAHCLHEAYPALEVREAATLEQGLALARAYPALSLALIDLGLPDGNGIDLVHGLRLLTPSCHVIVATIYDDDRNLFAALKAGARGYILKDQDKDKIIGYLRGLKQERPALSAATSRRLIEHFNQQGQALQQTSLSPREIEVTTLIGKGYTVEQAAASLGISADTVRSHVKNIYQKLDVNSRAELALAAVRLGLA